MKLIYIKSTITPKDYSMVREILKKERGEKLAPFIYKLSKLDSLEKYLNKENINYEVYQSIKTSQKENVFASYGEAIEDKEREKEAQELENAEEEDIINEEWQKRNFRRLNNERFTSLELALRRPKARKL